MDYFYMIAVKVEKYPLPLVPVMSVDDYGKLFNLLWDLTDGNIKVRDGGMMIEDLGS